MSRFTPGFLLILLCVVAKVSLWWKEEKFLWNAICDETCYPDELCKAYYVASPPTCFRIFPIDRNLATLWSSFGEIQTNVIFAVVSAFVGLWKIIMAHTHIDWYVGFILMLGIGESGNTMASLSSSLWHVFECLQCATLQLILFLVELITIVSL